MDAEELARAVRQQLGLGRLLPLGDADDGAWLAERAAVAALRAAVARALPTVRPEGLRLAPDRDADPDAEAPRAPAVPPPPSALPPGPLRVEAECAAPSHIPLPAVAERLREALLSAADRELGLRVTAVDLRFTDLLDGPGPGARPDVPAKAPPAPADEPRGTATAQAVLSVPGVARLAPALSPLLGGRHAEAVSVTDRAGPDGRTEGRHVCVQIATAQGARALDVARAARVAAAKAAAWDAEDPDTPVTVAVLVTAVDVANGTAEQGG